MSRRITASAYAAQIGRNEATVMRWCRNAAKGFPNKRFPSIRCYKQGNTWMIDPEGTERGLMLTSGNPIERDFARQMLRKS